MTFSQHGYKDTNHKTLLVLDEREGGTEGDRDKPLFGPKKRKVGQDQRGWG